MSINGTRKGSRAATVLRRSGALALMLAGPAEARDVLGIFGQWGAFRDAGEPRCFAISRMSGLATDKRWQPFAAIGYWPRKGVRGQINIRLSRELAPGAGATLVIGDKRFAMSGGGADIWVKDPRDDAAIIAAMRAGGTMSVRGRARTGSAISDQYELRGAATAIDAAALGCARLG